MTPQRKKMLRTLGVILAILIFLFFAFWWAYNRNKATDKNADTKVADTTIVSDKTNCPTESVVGIAITGAGLIELYQENARLKAENASLKAQLEDCLGGKKPAAKQKTGKKTDNNGNPNSKDKQGTDESSGGNKDKSSRHVNPNLVINEYEGDIVGDAGVSFNKDGYLCFYIKKSLEKSIENRTQSTSNLNGPSGAQGELVGEYIIYTTSILVMRDMLDNEWKWTAFLGYHTQYNFDMWLFHELIKLDDNDLKSNSQIQPNDSGGYHFVGKINYHTK